MFAFFQWKRMNRMGICVRFQKHSELDSDPALRFFRNKYPLDVWFRHLEAWWNLKSMAIYGVTGARDIVDRSVICSDSQNLRRFDLQYLGLRVQDCKFARVQLTLAYFSYRKSVCWPSVWFNDIQCVVPEVMYFGQQVTVIKILPIIGRWMMRLDIKQWWNTLW